jgi:hypothetical protein
MRRLNLNIKELNYRFEATKTLSNNYGLLLLPVEQCHIDEGKDLCN